VKGCEAGKMGCWEAMKRGSCKDRSLEDEKIRRYDGECRKKKSNGSKIE